jgi:phosphopantothenoylcysteine decarboxylase/phosphopantothenate--cysteine ligase
VKNISATSSEKMYQAVMKNIATLKFSQQDIFIGVAAVADYTPISPSAQKIKKSDLSLNIKLVKTKDILADVASLPNAPFCVGFAAETEHLIEYASAKRKAKKLPLIIANDVTSAMGSDENSVTLIDDAGAHALPKADKKTVAHSILMHMATMLKKRG